MLTVEQIKSVVLGHAVADALGVPAEFCSREELKENPITDMEGFGTYPYPAGSWSDDTSMALCALDVLAKGYCNFDEIMQNFCKWYYQDEFTPTGELFDAGNTCSTAIENYFKKNISAYECGLTDENSNGNGSLMRIYPFVLYALYKNLSTECALDLIYQASALTHAHNRSKIACGIYYFILKDVIRNPSLQGVYEGIKHAFWHYEHRANEEFVVYKKLFERIGNSRTNVLENEIKSSGYVVDTLEAAIWCVLNTSSYKECALKAVNLGDDTDTVACIAGSIAGLIYGYESIPKEWLAVLKKKEYFELLCETAFTNWTKEFGKYRLIDTHIHIVPHLDDGANDLHESVEMMKMAYKQGVRGIFCTSHSPYFDGQPEACYRNNCIRVIRHAKELFTDLQVFTGCEVFCDKNNLMQVLQWLKHDYATYNFTKYVLTEFSPDVLLEDMIHICHKIKMYGYTPVIAHAERYNVFEHPEIAEILIKLGCHLQVNLYSFVEEKDMQIKRRARLFLRRRQITFLGSDAHTLTHRPPNVESGLEYIYSRVGKAYADAICFRNAERLLMRQE